MRTVQPLYADQEGRVVPCVGASLLEGGKGHHALYPNASPLSAENGMEIKHGYVLGINETKLESRRLVAGEAARKGANA